MSESPTIFDPRRRALARDRAAASREARHDAADTPLDLLGVIGDELLDRLSDHRLTVERALVIGAIDERPAATLRASGAAVDVIEPSAWLASRRGAAAQPEAALEVEPGSYDLLLWPGGLESVDDVPGALLRARFALRPGGLLLGACFGEGSLPTLRSALAKAEQGARAARMHPQLSIATLAELLPKVGLEACVIDLDRYPLPPASLAQRARQRLARRALPRFLAHFLE